MVSYDTLINLQLHNALTDTLKQKHNICTFKYNILYRIASS